MAEHAKFTLDLQSLQKQLGQATYDRAREVYVMQKVSNDYSATQSSATEWQLSADVKGSGLTSHSVSIDVEMTAWGEISSWRSECDCPVHTRCKHAGALMLKAAYRSNGVVMQSRAKTMQNDTAVVDTGPRPAFPQLPPQNISNYAFIAKPTEQARNERDVQNWLDLFVEDSDDAPVPVGSDDVDVLDKPSGSGQDYLVFMLQMRKQRLQEQLHLSYGLAKDLQRGGWGKVRAVNHVDMSSLPEADAQIVKIIQAMGRSGNGSYYGYSLVTQASIEGDMGQLALRLAQETGRLFWSEDGKSLGAELHAGPSREVSWHWKERKEPDQKDVLWQLYAQVMPSPQETSEAKPSAEIYQNNPALYLNLGAKQFGLVASQGMPMPRLLALLQSPPIAQSAWLLHEQSLLRHLAGLPMPPFAKPPLEIKGIEPTWQLAASLVSEEQQMRFGSLMLTLEFDYHGTRFFSHRMGNPVLVDGVGDDNDSGRALLHRDLDAEKRAMGFLQAQQLQGNTRGQFYLPQHSPLSQMPWVRWVDEEFQSFKAAGFTVTVPEELKGWVQRADALHFEMQGKEEAAVVLLENAPDGSAIAEANDTSPWFDLSLGIEVQGQRINILPALPALIAQIKLLRSQLSEGAELQLPETMYVPHQGAWLRLPTEPLKPWLSALLELLDGSHNLSGESLRLSRLEALRLSAASQSS